MKLIDPHVHLRDWNQAHKETMEHAFDVAWKCGISALFEMPNTDPPLTTPEAVRRRIGDADRARAALDGHAPYHALYIGLTEDTAQVESAVRTHAELFPRVIGFKLYAGHSTGRMGVIASRAQHAIWRTLAEAGYRGVVAVHAEREDLLRSDLWDPEHPASHSRARPPIAEIASVQTQIAFAEAVDFRGTLHICHVTTPEVLEMIGRERSAMPFRLTAGVTPHHALLDTDRVTASAAPEAQARLMVNPPLRDPERRSEVLNRLLAGGADWIESDHAPHTLEEKRTGTCGLPGLPAFRLLADVLRHRLTPDTAASLCGERVVEVFDIDVRQIPENPYADEPWPELGEPALRSVWESVATEYPWDPYAPLISP